MPASLNPLAQELNDRLEAASPARLPRTVCT